MMGAAAAAAMTLGELLGAAAGAHAGIAVHDLVLDDRQVRAGAAFVAVPGTRAHGLDFAERAIARGAAVVLYEPRADGERVPQPSVAVPALSRRIGELARAFYGRAGPAPALAGVTGTNGKTTVAYLVAQAMGDLDASCGYIGTLGYGVPPALHAHPRTTPDCFSLHREIAGLGAEYVALEASSHALAQDRLAGLVVGTAAFTNLTRDHLDAHGDLASYGRAKLALFERPELASAVVNRDDPFSATIAGALGRGVRLIGTSLHAAPDAELVAAAQSRGLDGVALDVSYEGRRAHLSSRLVGAFNAENLLTALGVLLAWDRPLDTACAALAHCAPATGRMEVLGGGDAPHVVIDYAHTPDALERVLTALRAQTRGALWCVFGCGGERDRGKRPLMGEIAARLADRVVLTDDNPRGEPPAAIVADIRAGIDSRRSVIVEHARDAAIRLAVHGARRGDLVLVAGKGHEREQIVGDRTRPFDDHAVADEALGSRS